MANKIFDRDTVLDLTVNFIPLFIIVFFIVGFAVYPAFGTDLLPSALQFGLLVVPFVMLTVLTYLSGKAVSTAEKTSTVYPAGQATVPGVEPLHESEHEAENVPAETGEESGAVDAKSADSDGQ
ncbi:DUF6684 family protein [Halopelagius longus]|uniref:Cox cluster protein n=1 Tax=Halopelagius longus TaxID=1236180 RepID=A0A1H1C4N6_9EURY|nr:DUF6684 family protein [Halopelagius longus]RDI71066.1 cox cluster protein [Halopelagius longus]SDQ59143.1 hypothetical protein SAMN05216278_2111 [Halopelagius longus]